MKLSYKSAGVNINSGELFVDKIKPLVKTTFNQNVISGIGNFGAFYKLPLNKYKNPVFVSSIDGVGTKLKIAAALNKYDTIGEDLVNHCVNDIAVCGASPLFFLDYYAVGALKVPAAVEVVKGMVRGCKLNNCSLIGGETAEMPGVYHSNDFDLAGSITGVVERSKIISKDRVKRGDILIGLSSSGLHTNGYSLVRKIFDTPSKLKAKDSDLGTTIGDALLKVHRSYLNIIQNVTSSFKISSISHITGGGIEGNTKRVIPSRYKLKIDWNSWDIPFLFKLIQNKGKVTGSDMRKTFNMGIGLILICPEKISEKVIQHLKSRKEKAFIIGNVY